MTDLETAILDAWERVWPQLKNDPEELRRRIARRRSPTLLRPFRHDCIALRASDRRITPAYWAITPDHAMSLNHPDHPYEPIEHEVLIETRAIRQFCRPVRTDSWGEEVTDVARQLGTTPSGLRNARRAGQFSERKIPHLGGKPGHPIPLIHRWRALDPSSGRFFSAPDPICDSLWEWLPDMMPDNFEQPVTRVPVLSSFLKRRGTSGSGTPARLDIPDDHLYKDECQFLGWRWLCPSCKKPVRTLYYPLQVKTLCDWINFDPALSPLPASLQRLIAQASSPDHRRGDPCGRPTPSPNDADESLRATRLKSLRSQLRRIDKALAAHRSNRELNLPQKPLPTFACYKCHRVISYSGASASSWNLLISHLTAGLLYGCEVPPPSWHKPGQELKRRRFRQLTRQAPRREQVLRRLLNGWSNRRIARELTMSRWTVDVHIRHLCRQHDVPDRHALAAKLGAAVSPPLNIYELAAKRRFQVREFLLANLSYRQIMHKLSISWAVLNKDVEAIYRIYEVRGQGQRARRALAAKLNRPLPPTPGDLVRQRVSTLRQSGLSHTQIARKLHLSTGAVRHHLRRASKLSNLKSTLAESLAAPASQIENAPYGTASCLEQSSECLDIPVRGS